MFFNFGIKDLIDIFLVALILYYAYKVMKESRSLNVFFGCIFRRSGIFGFLDIHLTDSGDETVGLHP